MRSMAGSSMPRERSPMSFRSIAAAAALIVVCSVAGVAAGRALFAEACAACHGDKGQGGAADALVGGRGTLATAKPVKTIGSFWPYAPTVFDYVNRAMPFNAPQSLTPDQVYAVTAYLLFLNGIVSEDTTLDAASLAKVEMPNRNGFT